MTYSKHSLSVRTGLIAGVVFLAMTSGAVLAGGGSEALRTVFASDGKITASEAKRLATSHIRQLGFTRIGNSQMSAGIRGVRFADGVWQISVAYGGTKGHNRGNLLIDASTGQLLASPIVQYATDEPFEREASETGLADSQAESN